MTTMYSAHIEVNSKKLTPDMVDELMQALAAFHPSVGQSPRGYVGAQITLPAENLLQATTTAVAVVERATGATAIAAEVMTEAEFDARQGFIPVPDLLSVSEVAERLGITRTAVQKRIDAHGFVTAQKVGNAWVVAEHEVAALLNA
ncbi:helix-turn-helix domain-containing protein [Agromyces badenianii]|uniref:helix-turn-helix domain-containing protein n=1 Tax=Agromyces badenianii TaxID=2080742 RepID=UPI000D59DDCE|nr:helix-turn-helix domain-containing protein [Agromyces badenianii]PWC05425.1 DNA-binding protein [Agromyces badenianii]